MELISKVDRKDLYKELQKPVDIRMTGAELLIMYAVSLEPNSDIVESFINNISIDRQVKELISSDITNNLAFDYKNIRELIEQFGLFEGENI